MAAGPPSTRRSSLEEQVAALARRVARLERATEAKPPRRPAPPPTDQDLALVDRLAGRRAPRYRGPGVRGAVAYAGAARLGEREVRWIQEHPLPELLAIDPALVARTLAALGHPARLLVVRALLRQPHSSQQLQGVLAGSSPGQLYHHLKDLLAAGLVRQSARSQYEIASHQVVPLLATLAAAADATGAAPAAAAPPPPGDPPE